MVERKKKFEKKTEKNQHLDTTKFIKVGTFNALNRSDLEVLNE
jgi:hypothetical protein